MPTIEMHGRSIGDGHPCFIIAEAGVNHNGDLALAERLILEAKNVGADCVKFQTFVAKETVTALAPKANYQLSTTDSKETQLEMLERLQLRSEAYPTLFSKARGLGIPMLSTPYNRGDVDFLDSLGVEAFKLASIHVTEIPLLKYIASKGKPILLSTGMATLAEVDEAVRAIRSAGNEQIVLLQCTTNYPSRPEEANLRAMVTMKMAFGTLVGYSDHTQSHTCAMAAVALGACLIEKHFTIDKSLSGPDHSSSAEPGEFRELVGFVRETELALGSSRKEPTAIEKKNSVGMRRSLVLNRSLAAGEILTEEMVTFKRPATGLSPKFLDDLIGKRTRRHLSPDTLIRWDDFE